MWKPALIVLLALILLSSNVNAQEGVDRDYFPVEMLNRTFFIKSGDVKGTGFSVDYQGKMYIITARHVVAGVPTRDAIIQIWQQEHWQDYHTVKTILPSSDDVDIAIFETNEKVEQPYRVTVNGTENTGLAQQVWFFGYPFELETHFKSGKIAPFVKRGMVSAIDFTKPDAVVLYVDGFNNPGFSGGPIVFWDLSKRAYEILGVVHGYRPDTAKAVVNGQRVDTNVLVNSGILVGYSIEHAMKAIEDSRKQATVTK